jgi:hypothetical protein
MTSGADPTVVKLNELDDLVNAVPYLLGFTPAESIVVISVKGRRERLEFTVRLDLLPPEHDEDVARMLAGRMKFAGADAVMVFVFTDDEPTEWRLPRRALVDRVVDAMSMPVVEAVLVTDARIWSYLCDDEVCCPPQGRERSLSTKGSLALSAAHALNGRAVLPNRDAVVASVQAVTGIRRAEMERAIDDATAAHAAIEPRRARTRARRLANKLRARYQERPGTLTDTEAAALIVALHDHQLRDVMIGWADGDPDAMRSLFHDLVRLAVPPLDAPACTSLAWCSYLDGDGLVATVALERALASDPAYSLALLLNEAIERQMPPSSLRWASTG